jgi:hypothetical protein
VSSKVGKGAGLVGGWTDCCGLVMLVEFGLCRRVLRIIY